jgi:hypothetical protein
MGEVRRAQASLSCSAAGGDPDGLSACAPCLGEPLRLAESPGEDTGTCAVAEAEAEAEAEGDEGAVWTAAPTSSATVCNGDVAACACRTSGSACAGVMSDCWGDAGPPASRRCVAAADTRACCGTTSDGDGTDDDDGLEYAPRGLKRRSGPK